LGLDGMVRLEMAALGLSTVESLPLFHYSPGGLAVRPLMIGAERPLYNCEGFDVCLFARGPSGFEVYEVPLDKVLARARAWKADLLFLDGLEPLAGLSREALAIVAEEARRRGLAVGARTMGYRLDPSMLDLLDVVIVDYMPDYWHDIAMSVDAIRAVKESLARDVWLEVSAYIKEPDKHRLHPLLLALKGTPVPLHVYVEEHRGGMPLTRMAEELRREREYVYIHNDLYPSLDTECPKCNAPVASRDEGVLRVLELGEGGGCWKCGHPLPFHRVQRKKTPERILYTLGGVSAWYPVDRMASSGLEGTSERRFYGSP